MRLSADSAIKRRDAHNLSENKCFSTGRIIAGVSRNGGSCHDSAFCPFYGLFANAVRGAESVTGQGTWGTLGRVVVSRLEHGLWADASGAGALDREDRRTQNNGLAAASSAGSAGGADGGVSRDAPAGGFAPDALKGVQAAENRSLNAAASPLGCAAPA